jgi:O-antigen ligase
MTKFKLLSVAAILSTVIATPGIAQQAAQEPGLQAFYQRLGVDPAQAGRRALWHQHAPAAHMRARR